MFCQITSLQQGYKETRELERKKRLAPFVFVSSWVYAVASYLDMCVPDVLLGPISENIF